MDINSSALAVANLTAKYYNINDIYFVTFINGLLVFLLGQLKYYWYSYYRNSAYNFNRKKVCVIVDNIDCFGYYNINYKKLSNYIIKNTEWTTFTYHLSYNSKTLGLDSLVTPLFCKYLNKNFELKFESYKQNDKNNKKSIIISSSELKLVEILDFIDSLREDLEIKLFNNDNESFGKGRTINFSKSWNEVFLDKTIKQDILDDITLFQNNKELYKQKGQSYSRGYFLHGMPGCGKTSLIKTISKEFNRNVYNLKLNNISNEYNFNRITNNIRENSIIILEDIDCVTSCLARSENSDVSPISSGIHLDLILNFIDGVDENGHIFIMTSNHKDKLDPALFRPGRFDLSIELTLCSKSMFYEIFNFYTDKNIEDFNKNFEFKEYIYSPAYIINLCFSNREKPEKIFETLH